MPMAPAPVIAAPGGVVVAPAPAFGFGFPFAGLLSLMALLLVVGVVFSLVQVRLPFIVCVWLCVMLCV